MNNKRRNLVKALPLGALFPWQVVNGLASSNSLNYPDSKRLDVVPQTDVDALYDKALVVDGLVIPRGWNADSFAALAKAGYSGFNASLDSRDLVSALASLADWRQRIVDHEDVFVHVQNAEDFVRAKAEGKVGVVFGFQNATMMETSIDNLDTLYKAGTRWIQLTYNQRNLLGDGCTERTNAGLSDFGIEAVERMNELGIVIDVSHSGRQTTDDGIAFSKTGVSINHSMCEALYKEHPRAKTDAQIRAMADKGGVIGIICLGYMIGPDPGGETTLENYVDHIDHAVQVAGIDHVGVASDYAIEGLEANGATRENWYVPRLTRFKPSYQVRWPPWIPELDSTDRYRHVARVLDKRGYSAGDIEKILEQNWLRYYREVLKG